MSSASDPLSEIVSSQLESLDDADHLASAWADAVEEAGDGLPKWGGRGRGGRGLSRRTFQPHDVVLENVSLEYINNKTNVSHRTLLNGTSKLKLLHSRIYALVGRNGYGKSTLLRRIHGKKIPGFPTHLSTMYVPQEVTSFDLAAADNEEEELEGRSGSKSSQATPLEIVMAHGQRVQQQNEESNRIVLASLEEQLESLDSSQEGAEEKMEELCNVISQLEDDDDDDKNEKDDKDTLQREEALDALEFFGFDRTAAATQPMDRWTGGWRKRVLLAAILVFDPDLILLDEPTNHMDVAGIVQLRRLLRCCAQDRQSTVLLVSHDLDLLTDVPTDVIYLHQQQLTYYPGTYRDFVGYRAQALTHAQRRAGALEKQRGAMMESIDYMRRQNAAKRGDKTKNNRTIASRKKKLERHGLEKDEHGHRWTAQKAGTGIRPGSINSVDATTRKKATTTQLLSNRPETQMAPVVDKEVQFVFPEVTSFWAGPLIMAMDVGHGYPTAKQQAQAQVPRGTKKPGFLFDCVDLSIDEGSVTCILGANGSGKSTLLRLLAGMEIPLEGKVTRAHQASVAYIGQHVADDLLVTVQETNGSAPAVAAALTRALFRSTTDTTTTEEHTTTSKDQEKESNDQQQQTTPLVTATPLSVLHEAFPTKTEQELRGELTAFGLNPQQATTNVRFLSGGERSRLCLAMAMLQSPQVLLLDEPTNHLDPESVEALATGLVEWNGTVVLVTHDAHLIRRVGGTCFVLTDEDGKLRRVPGGIDYYLQGMSAVYRRNGGRGERDDEEQ